MTGGNRIEILPGVYGTEYTLTSTPAQVKDYTELVNTINNKPKIAPGVLKNKWSERNTSKDSISRLQFEIPTVIVNPTINVLEHLERLDNVHQVITADAKQKIYNKCIQYCVDVRNPSGVSHNSVGPHNTIVYPNDLYTRRKVIHKLWSEDDIRRYNLIDIQYYDKLIDMTYGTYPSCTLAYVEYLKHVMYPDDEYIALACIDISTLPPKDQTYIRSCEYIRVYD